MKPVVIIVIAVMIVIGVSSIIAYDQYTEWQRETFLEEQENKFNSCVVKYGISPNIQDIEKFTDCVEGLTIEVQEFKKSQGITP